MAARRCSVDPEPQVQAIICAALTTRRAMRLPPALSSNVVLSKELAWSFCAGVALGGVVWLLAAVQPGNMNSFSMAVLLLASASAAAIAFLLSRTERGTTAPMAQHVVQIQRWLCAIGGGVLLAIQGLNAL